MTVESCPWILWNPNWTISFHSLLVGNFWRQRKHVCFGLKLNLVQVWCLHGSTNPWVCAAITSFHSFNFNSFDTATINPPDDIELFGFKFSMRLDSKLGIWFQWNIGFVHQSIDGNTCQNALPMEWSKKVLLVGGTAAAALAVLWYLRKVVGVCESDVCGLTIRFRQSVGFGPGIGTGKES